MPLHLFGANDPDLLIAAVRQAQRLAVDELPPGPQRALQGIPLIVPDLARREWVRRAIAEADGIAAGLALCLPDEFLSGVLGPAVGHPGPRWRRPLATGRILRDLRRIPQLAPALGGEELGQRAWNLATALAEGFERWSMFRPSDTAAGPAWRQELWRGIHDARMGDPRRWLDGLVDAVDANPEHLPPTVILLDVVAPSPALWRVLTAIAAHRRVVVMGIVPTWGDWSWVQRWSSEPGERLLASWGTAARRLACSALERGAEDHRFEQCIATPDGDGLLATLQRTLADPGSVQPTASDDGSIRFHDAIGLRRQVQVVRHELARRFAEDPTLRPHEVALLCPDPEAVGPLAAALFSSPGEGPVVPLTWRTSRGDPALAGAEVAARLVALLPSRFEASAVLDLLAHPLVLAHHRLTLDDTARWRTWLDSCDARWGCDAAHRAALGLPAIATGTWSRALLRLELACWIGAEVGDAALYGDDDGVVPAAGLSDEDLPRARQFISLIRPLLRAAPAWRQPRPATAWRDELLALLLHLTGDGPHLAKIQGSASSWHDTIIAADPDLAVSAGCLAAAIAAGNGAGSSALGGVAVGTVSALGGLPWRVVALIGFEDGAFPRQVPRSDLDPLAADPQPEDPDPRAEDRLRLLQTVVATRDALLVTWSGRDEQRGETLPPAPVIQELLAAVSQVAGCAAEALITRHPLHAAHGRPAVWPSAALRQQAEGFSRRSGLADGAARPTSAVMAAVAALDPVTMVEALRSPPAAYLRTLGVHLEETPDPPRDWERFTLDGLETYGLDRRILDGTDDRRLVAEGLVAPGILGCATLAGRRNLLDPLLGWWARTAPRLTTVSVDLTIDGQRISGRIHDVLPGVGPVVVRSTAAKARHLLRMAVLTLLWRLSGDGDTTPDGTGLIVTPEGKNAILRWKFPVSQHMAMIRAVLGAVRDAQTRPVAATPDLLEQALDPATADAAHLRRAWRQAWSADHACTLLWPDPASADLDQLPALAASLAPLLTAWEADAGALP